MQPITITIYSDGSYYLPAQDQFEPATPALLECSAIDTTGELVEVSS